MYIKIAFTIRILNTNHNMSITNHNMTNASIALMLMLYESTFIRADSAGKRGIALTFLPIKR